MAQKEDWSKCNLVFDFDAASSTGGEHNGGPEDLDKTDTTTLQGDNIEIISVDLRRLLDPTDPLSPGDLVSSLWQPYDSSIHRLHQGDIAPTLLNDTSSSEAQFYPRLEESLALRANGSCSGPGASATGSIKRHASGENLNGGHAQGSPHKQVRATEIFPRGQTPSPMEHSEKTVDTTKGLRLDSDCEDSQMCEEPFQQLLEERQEVIKWFGPTLHNLLDFSEDQESPSIPEATGATTSQTSEQSTLSPQALPQTTPPVLSDIDKSCASSANVETELHSQIDRRKFDGKGLTRKVTVQDLINQHAGLTPEQIMRDHPEDMRGGCLLAIQDALANALQEPPSGRLMEALYDELLGEGAHDYTDVKFRKIRSLAHMAEAAAEKKYQRKPRCSKCAHDRRPCSIRANGDQPPCNNCIGTEWEKECDVSKCCHYLCGGWHKSP